MKHKYLYLAILPILLTSCNNGINGASFIYDRCVDAIYQEGYNESTFFDGYSEFFTSRDNFIDKAAHYYCTTGSEDKLTYNGLLNFTNQSGLGLLYNRRPIYAYEVNYEAITESIGNKRCSYFSDVNGIKFVTTSIGGSEYVDYVIDDFIYLIGQVKSYSYKDTSIILKDNILTMKLRLTLSTKVGNGEEVSRYGDFTLSWNKK